MITKQTTEDDKGFRLAKEQTVAQVEKEAKKASKGSSKATLPHQELDKG